jgi:hypothetical protein
MDFGTLTTRIRIAFALLALVATPSFAYANEKKDAETTAKKDLPGKEAEKKSDIAPKERNEKIRNFYQVLEDVLADFEYDIKNGQVKGLKDLALRNIATSENVPPSFKSHIELLVTERVLTAAKTRVIQCQVCRSKRASLSADNIVIQSPDTNPAELTRLAQAAGILNFMDVAFAYQPTGMILSLFVTEAESGSVVWSRSYNSETSRAAAFRRGVDYSQIDEARKNVEYVPTIQYRPTFYYLFAQNVGETSGALGLGLRVNERYDNRKKEVGFELNYFLDSASIAGSDATEAEAAQSLYGSLNFTLLFVHAWNLIGDLESYNRMRGSIFAAIGGTYASGFLGGLVRGGYEWRMGKHWGIQAVLGYRPSATRFIDGSSVGIVSGVEFGLGISALF